MGKTTGNDVALAIVMVLMTPLGWVGLLCLAAVLHAAALLVRAFN